MRYRIAIAILATCGSIASAQSVFNPPSAAPTPYSRPTLSPYLNLLRGGDPAANYYLGVWPEFERRYQQSRSPLAVESARPEPTLDDRAELELREKMLPPTGHPTGFMIYNAYYNLPNQRSFIPYNPGAARPVR